MESSPPAAADTMPETAPTLRTQKARSFWDDAFYRFRHNWVGMAGLAVLIAGYLSSDWLGVPLGVVACAGAALLVLLLLPVPAAGCAAICLMLVVMHAAMLNQAPAGAYFSQTLQTWEQGRFIRFNGVAQWLGWLWPYLVMVLVLQRLTFWRRIAVAHADEASGF